VVNPYNVGQEGEHSPEAQAFQLLMQAAWRDWVAAGSKGLNGVGPTGGNVPVVGMMAAVLGIVLMLTQYP
jgi:flagellar motor component MotA